MRSGMVAFAFSVLLLGSSRPTFGQNQPETSLSDLHREIAQLKTILAELTKRLEAVEQRLSRMEATLKRPDGKLLFPIEVERAMIGEANFGRLLLREDGRFSRSKLNSKMIPGGNSPPYRLQWQLEPPWNNDFAPMPPGPMERFP